MMKVQITRARQLLRPAVVGALLAWLATTTLQPMAPSPAAPYHRHRHRYTMRRQRRHRVARLALRPSIKRLNPDGYTYENGPDFHYDSTHHGAADNPASISLLVAGRHFKRKSVVLFNGAALSTTFVSTTRLKATLPMDDIMNADYKNDAKAAVTVSNPAAHKGVQAQLAAPAPFAISHWAMGG